MSKVSIITKKGVKREGKVVIPFEFDDIMQATVDGKKSQEIFLTINNDLLGLAKIIKKENGKETYLFTDNDYHEIEDFKNNVAIISIYDERFGNKYGLIDINLNILLDCKYDKITFLDDKLFLVDIRGKYGVYKLGDKTDKLIIPCNFSKITLIDRNKLQLDL